jgi:hypothetical protein
MYRKEMINILKKVLECLKEKNNYKKVCKNGITRGLDGICYHFRIFTDYPEYTEIINIFFKRYQEKFPDDNIIGKYKYLSFGVGNTSSLKIDWFGQHITSINDLYYDEEVRDMWWGCRIQFLEEWIEDLKK